MCSLPSVAAIFRSCFYGFFSDCHGKYQLSAGVWLPNIPEVWLGCFSSICVQRERMPGGTQRTACLACSPVAFTYRVGSLSLHFMMLSGSNQPFSGSCSWPGTWPGWIYTTQPPQRANAPAPVPDRISLVKARLLSNKTLLLKDFFMSHGWDVHSGNLTVQCILWTVATWLLVIYSPRTSVHRGGLTTIYKESYTCKEIMQRLCWILGRYNA